MCYTMERNRMVIRYIDMLMPASQRSWTMESMYTPIFYMRRGGTRFVSGCRL